MQVAQFLIEKADQCFLLGKHAECACGANNDTPAQLQSLGNQLLAKAVELDTARQKAAKTV